MQIKTKRDKRKIALRVLIVLLVIGLLGVTYVFAFPYKANAWVEHDNIEFDATYDTAEDYGFVDANTLTDTERLVAENANFELFLDETTSHFYIRDKATGGIIESNPRIKDPRRPTGNVEIRQKATIEYYTINENGEESARNDNYLKSIYHEETADEADKGKRTFKLKQVENGFQVYYQITDLAVDYLYFPLYIPAEQYEPFLELDRTDPVRNALVQVYSDVLDPETGMYKATVYEGMRLQRRNALYKIFYVDKLFGEYSRERVIEENAEHGYFDTVVRFGFEIALEVTIDELGFQITVIDNSINEYTDSGSMLSRLSLFPHFGTAIDQDPETGDEKSGYIVIPDGSGAVIEFNKEDLNTSVYAPTYTKRLYGHDLAMKPFKMPEAQEDIMLPLYGMVKEDIGFAAIITQGSGQTEINAGHSSVNKDSYYKVFPTFRYRESESTVLGGGWNTHRINIISRTRVKTDFSIKYVLLTGDNNNYVGIANAYQNYLVAEKGLVKKDNLDSNKVILDLIGAYNTRKFFLGIPYNSMDSLTTFKQAETIVNEVLDLGVTDIDIIYNGINKEGINNGVDNNVKISSKLGGKRGFKKLEENLSEHNIKIYPTANVVTTNDFNRAFDQYKYSSRRIIGELSKDFVYNVPTKLPNSLSQEDGRKEHYVINPVYYETILNAKNNSYRYDNLFLTSIGSRFAGSYDRYKELFKEQSLLIHERLLSNLEDQNIALSNPAGMAIPYASLITDLPVDTTLYPIFNYSIPLVQLVLSGYVEYTSSSINTPSERDVQYKFLKALETGSNLKYTLTYDNSLKLLTTSYNEYMSTEYTNWLEDIKRHNKTINDLNIGGATLVGHRRITNNVFESTYSNGVVIVINYGITRVEVGGVTIPSLDFIVKEGA